MRFQIKLFIFLLFFISLHCNNPFDSDDEKKETEEWVLVWEDNFNGTGSPSPTKWDQPEYNRRNNDNGPDGWWLKEDAYLDGKGKLVIRARKIYDRNYDRDPYDYATGAIRSKGRFEQRYGKFEIKCKLPTQPGWWVAFWLMSESVGNVNGSGEDGTEIDIFEGFGWTNSINHALHWDGYGEQHQSQGKRVSIDGIREGYHTFMLEWEANEYRFFIDGGESWRTSAGGVSKVPAYVKITGELSTESWAINEYWSNDPEAGVYPDSFLVDYVKVYRRNQ